MAGDDVDDPYATRVREIGRQLAGDLFRHLIPDQRPPTDPAEELNRP